MRTIGIATACFALWACTPNESGNDASGASSDDTAAGSDSSGMPACTDPDSQVLWANEGMLMPPMELGFADSLGFDVARSLSPEAGTLTLSFTTNCGGPLYVFGLLWDATGGSDTENADSLYLSIDGGEELTWLYGCSTVTGVDDQWYWLPLEQWTMANCEHLPPELDLPAGDHTIVVRNREQGAGVDVAAIGALVVSHDPGVDLNQYHDLTE
ncbi:MAG: hypothetical protein KDK70_13450 [Myxococcales bacterium]|nr:hypothetical protein [Myxococcales bacterium]